MGCRLSASPRPGAEGKKKSPTPFGAGLRGCGTQAPRFYSPELGHQFQDLSRHVALNLGQSLAELVDLDGLDGGLGGYPRHRAQGVETLNLGLDFGQLVGSTRDAGLSQL